MGFIYLKIKFGQVVLGFFTIGLEFCVIAEEQFYFVYLTHLKAHLCPLPKILHLREALNDQSVLKA